MYVGSSQGMLTEGGVGLLQLEQVRIISETKSTEILFIKLPIMLFPFVDRRTAHLPFRVIKSRERYRNLFSKLYPTGTQRELKIAMSIKSIFNVLKGQNTK